MNEDTKAGVIIIGFLMALILIVIGIMFVVTTSYEKEQAPLDSFCQNENYDKSLGIKTFAGMKFIKCVREMAILDANDRVIEFKTIKEYFVYSDEN